METQPIETSVQKHYHTTKIGGDQCVTCGQTVPQRDEWQRTPETSVQEEREEIFYEKFVLRGFIHCPVKNCKDPSCGVESIKRFIRSLLAKEHKVRYEQGFEDGKKDEYEQAKATLNQKTQ